jgi:hypothetical protein
MTAGSGPSRGEALSTLRSSVLLPVAADKAIVLCGSRCVEVASDGTFNPAQAWGLLLDGVDPHGQRSVELCSPSLAKFFWTRVGSLSQQASTPPRRRVHPCTGPQDRRTSELGVQLEASSRSPWWGLRSSRRSGPYLLPLPSSASTSAWLRSCIHGRGIAAIRERPAIGLWYLRCGHYPSGPHVAECGCCCYQNGRDHMDPRGSRASRLTPGGPLTRLRCWMRAHSGTP